MIYVIVNQSHEWDEPICNEIDFISTSLDKAIEVWEKYYSNYETLDASKWCYSADLRQYKEDYFVYGLQNSEFETIKHYDNSEG